MFLLYYTSVDHPIEFRQGKKNWKFVDCSGDPGDVGGFSRVDVTNDIQTLHWRSQRM